MEIDEVQRALAAADADRKKEKFTGTVEVRLSYVAGGIAKASQSVDGPLVPGARPPLRTFDKPRENFG